MLKINIFIFTLLFSFSTIANTGGNPSQKELSPAEQAAIKYEQQKRVQYIQKMASFAPFVLGVGAAAFLTSRENRILKVAGMLLGGFFSQQMLASSLSGPMMRASNSASMWATSFLPGATQISNESSLEKVLIELEACSIEFQQRKSKISPDAQTLFERLRGAAQTAKSSATYAEMVLGNTDAAASEALKKQLEKVTSLMRMILNLPQASKELGDYAVLMEKVAPILNRYSKEIQTDMEEFTIGLWRAAQLPQGKKSVIFLVGEPGTGKTTFAEMYAEALGLPLITIGDLEKAFQTSEPLFRWGDNLNENFKLSPFSDRLTKAKDGQNGRVPKNAILFLDEIDKFLNKPENAQQSGFNKAYLYDLLDPGKTKIKLQDLDIEYDFDNFIVIAAANDKFKGESLRGIAEGGRLLQIHFPCIEQQKRPEIAKKRFELEMAKRPDLAITDKDLEIIADIAAKDPYCGVRSLELVVDDYVNWKDLARMKPDVYTEFDILRKFKNRPSSLFKNATTPNAEVPPSPDQEGPSFWQRWTGNTGAKG